MLHHSIVRNCFLKYTLHSVYCNASIEEILQSEADVPMIVIHVQGSRSLILPVMHNFCTISMRLYSTNDKKVTGTK